jgi:DnaJ-class molecular chaperone
MKRITEQNYYQLLDISPQASFQEVRSAYDHAMSIYSDDSISTYSLFSQKERKFILSLLVDAYKILTNSQLRAEYNQSLIERGELSPEEIGPSLLEESDTDSGTLKEVKVESLLQKNERAESVSQHLHTNLDLFKIDSTVTGKSIQALRLAMEISIEEINRKTNIPKKTLENIEEEHFEKLPALVYLKGFLKAYAEILNVNESQMVDGYVKRFLEWKATVQK